jgi:hypothetical protein
MPPAVTNQDGGCGSSESHQHQGRRLLRPTVKRANAAGGQGRERQSAKDRVRAICSPINLLRIGGLPQNEFVCRLVAFFGVSPYLRG